MSDYRFSADDHRLNVDPAAHDGFCGYDFDDAAWVEVDNNMFVRERTCRFALEPDRERLAEREGMTDGEWTTRDIPLAWTCGSCGEQYAPVAPFPAWIKHCPSCGARVTEVKQ